MGHQASVRCVVAAPVVLAAHIIWRGHCCREYYFSAENLVKDEFLRRRMDVDGYVPVTLLIAFPRIGR